MDFLTNKPHVLFWISGLVVLLITPLGNIDTLDINLHDTYYVIDGWHISFLISLIFSGIGLIYWGLKKNGFRFTSWMTILHLILTLDLSLLIALIVFFKWFDDPGLYNNILAALILLIFVGQLIFFINVISALAKGKRNSTISRL